MIRIRNSLGAPLSCSAADRPLQFRACISAASSARGAWTFFGGLGAPVAADGAPVSAEVAIDGVERVADAGRAAEELARFVRRHVPEAERDNDASTQADVFTMRLPMGAVDKFVRRHSSPSLSKRALSAL